MWQEMMERVAEAERPRCEETALVFSWVREWFWKVENLREIRLDKQTGFKL